MTTTEAALRDALDKLCADGLEKAKSAPAGLQIAILAQTIGSIRAALSPSSGEPASVAQEDRDEPGAIRARVRKDREPASVAVEAALRERLQLIARECDRQNSLANIKALALEGLDPSLGGALSKPTPVEAGLREIAEEAIQLLHDHAGGLGGLDSLSERLAALATPPSKEGEEA